MAMTKAERRAYQAGLESDMESYGDARARSEQHRPIKDKDRCPATVGRRHSFFRQGDGVYRCCYCKRTRAEAEAL